jgi:predicted CxxxxCH...CXXCH cytochrome family protein
MDQKTTLAKIAIKAGTSAMTRSLAIARVVQSVPDYGGNYAYGSCLAVVCHHQTTEVGSFPAIAWGCGVFIGTSGNGDWISGMSTM